MFSSFANHLVRPLVAALALSAAAAVSAQATHSGASTVARTSVQAAAAQAQSSAAQSFNDGPRQGIRVSGWWRIDVKNPDGTLAKHIEFENALSQPYGANTLAALIAGTSTSGGLSITAVSDDISVNPCNHAACRMIGANTYAAPGCLASKGCFTTLTTAVGSGAITLSGSATATVSGTIIQVTTQIGTCKNTVATNVCTTSTDLSPTSGALTFQNLPDELSVAAGQIVQFTVVLSFS